MSCFPRLRNSRPVGLGLALCFWLPALGGICAAEAFKITVVADQPGARINPAMWGVFFEDINFGADGGLYAELVKNRSFEFPDHLMGWSTLRKTGFQGSVSIRDETPFDLANPHYVRINAGSGSWISQAWGPCQTNTDPNIGRSLNAGARFNRQM